MIKCPVGKPCKYWGSFAFVVLHLQWAHGWSTRATTDWMTSYVHDAMDSMPSKD